MNLSVYLRVWSSVQFEIRWIRALKHVYYIHLIRGDIHHMYRNLISETVMKATFPVNIFEEMLDARLYFIEIAYTYREDVFDVRLNIFFFGKDGKSR